MILPIGAPFTTREVLDAAALGQLLGLLLLSVAAFQAVPEIFPDRHLRWGNDVHRRGVVAVGAVLMSTHFSALYGAIPRVSATQHDTGVVAVVASLVGIAVATVVADKLPAIEPDVPLVYYRRPVPEPEYVRPPLNALLSRMLVITTLAGALLAVVARLYPLPELVVVAVWAYQTFVGPVRGERDIAERLVGGLRVVWEGHEGVVGVGYGVGAILLAVWFDALMIAPMTNRSAVAGDPLALSFVVATLGVGTLHVVVAATRFVERLPAALGDTVTDDAGPRVPGLMLPAAALFVLYILVVPETAYTGSPSYALTVSASEVVAAVVLAVVALVVVLRPGAFPTVGLSDYHATVLAPSLFGGLWAGLGLWITGYDDLGVLAPVAAVYVMTVACLSPYLGYELFDTEHEESPVAELGGEAVVALMAGGAVVVASLVVRPILESFVHPDVVGFLVSSFLLPCMFGVGLRLVLVALYLPSLLGGTSDGRSGARS